MLEQVFEIVKQQGPVLPVEVATKLKIDSFVAHAYLMQLAEANRILAGKEKIGNVFLYYLPGKESAANLRVSTLLQQGKKTAKTFKSTSTPVSSGVAEKREAFAQRLKEIEKREEKEKKQKQTAAPISDKEYFIEKFKQAITPFLTKPEELEIEPEIKIEPEPETVQPKEEIKPEIKVIEPKEELKKEEVEVKKEEPKLKKKPKRRLFGPKTDIVELATEYLLGRGAEIISKDVKKKNDVEFIIQVPSGIGPVKMLVKAKDKKSINEADLSLTYTEGQNKKLPVLFLTTGKLTKTAQNYLKVISGLLKVRFLMIEDK